MCSGSLQTWLLPLQSLGQITDSAYCLIYTCWDRMRLYRTTDQYIRTQEASLSGPRALRLTTGISGWIQNWANSRLMSGLNLSRNCGTVSRQTSRRYPWLRRRKPNSTGVSTPTKSIETLAAWPVKPLRTYGASCDPRSSAAAGSRGWYRRCCLLIPGTAIKPGKWVSGRGHGNAFKHSQRSTYIPGAWSEYQTRCYSSFSFSIYYRVENEAIVVIAVMHGSRHPLRWKTRE